MSTTRRQFLVGAATAPALAGSAIALSSTPAVHSSSQTDAAKEHKAAPLAATLILVRHTEKEKSGGSDPELSKEGIERADEFARMFSAAGVTALLHSEFKRTRDTLAPLAKALKIESEVIGADAADQLVARLSAAKAGEVIAIAGHSNTIPGLAWEFGVKLPGLETPLRGLEYGFLPHSAYDRIHVLTAGTEGAQLMELRYGAASDQDDSK